MNLEIQRPGAAGFVDWLLDKKKEKELKTDGQLAEFLNVRQDTMSMIIHGKRGPSAQFVQTILESQDIQYGDPEYTEVLRAAHLMNLDIENRRRRFDRE